MMISRTTCACCCFQVHLFFFLLAVSIPLAALSSNRLYDKVPEIEWRGRTVMERLTCERTLTVETYPPHAMAICVLENDCVGISWEPASIYDQNNRMDITINFNKCKNSKIRSIHPISVLEYTPLKRCSLFAYNDYDIFPQSFIRFMEKQNIDFKTIEQKMNNKNPLEDFP